MSFKLRFPPYLHIWLRCVNKTDASVNDGLGPGHQSFEVSVWRSFNGDRWRDVCEDKVPDASVPSGVFVSLAVALLSLVYQYLTGNADLGSSKSYSRSSLDFRDIYVAVVLFLGAYVWIKFREVALRGAHKRTRVDKQGRTKEVYDARLTPPKWNGETVPKLELGQFATEQEAHHKFLIAAFYYNRDPGLLDGWFQVPTVSEGERSLTGGEKRAWVIDQAKKVYQDFKKKEADLLLQEYLEDPVTPEQDEVTVDFSIPLSLNTDEHQQPALSSQVENLGMDMAMPDNQGWECASHCLGGVHEGLALSNCHSLGFEEGSALPVSQLPPTTESGMSLNGSDQWDLLPTRVSTQQQQIYLQQQISDLQQQITLQHQQISDQQQQITIQHQQISDQQQQIALQRRQIQELGAQMLQFEIGDEDGAGAGAEQASP